jgi:hypothetical protein
LQASSVSATDSVEGTALLLTACGAHADKKLLRGPTGCCRSAVLLTRCCHTTAA